MITMDGCSGVIVYLSQVPITHHQLPLAPFPPCGFGLTWVAVQRCVDDNVSIVSSKCSELNVVIPGKKEDDDPVEIPIPEQYETRVVNGQLVTTPVSHVGA